MGAVAGLRGGARAYLRIDYLISRAGPIRLGFVPGDAAPFACPRCGSTVTDRFWGPCQSCRNELTAVIRGHAEQLETRRYEPVMHVVPNHVATKD
jgi:hypothetical protein